MPDRSRKTRLQRARDAARSGLLAARAASDAGLLAQLSPSGVAAFLRQARGHRPGSHTALLLHACNKPEQLAVADGRRHLCWADLDREVNQLAHALAARGVREGDCVAVMTRNGVEAVVTGGALERLGAAALWMNHRLESDAMAAVLTETAPTAAVVHRDYQPAFERARDAARPPAGPASVDNLDALDIIEIGPTGASRATAGIAPWDQALASQPGATPPNNAYSSAGATIAHSAGTRGLPHGRRTGSAAAAPAALDLVRRMHLSAADRHLVACPLHQHTAGVFARTLAALGATTLTLDHFDAERFLDVVERERATGAFLVPAMIHRLLALPERVWRARDVSSLRWVASGDGPLPAATARRFQERFGYMLWNVYAATELGLVSLAGPYDHQARPGTVGTALGGHRIEIRDERGRPARTGELGRVWVVPAAPGASAASAGDIGRLDADGQLVLVGHADDEIPCGDRRLYPHPIESAIHEHPAVTECAVVGATDHERGDRATAFVVARRGPLSRGDDVRAAAEAVLAEAGVSGEVMLVDSLPRLPTGQVVRGALRKGGR